MAQIIKYAKTVINQRDKQFPTRLNWENPENAQGYVTNTYAEGWYNWSKKYKELRTPHTLYAYDFDCGLPEHAVVTGYKFEIRMRKTQEPFVKKPIAIFNSFEKGIFKTSSIEGEVDPKGETGTYNGVYRIVPRKNLSKSWSTYTYEMPAENLKSFKDLNGTINSQGFGLQLRFPESGGRASVQIVWIRVVIDYEMPNRSVSFEILSGKKYIPLSRDETVPTQITSYNHYEVRITTTNNSIASGDNEVLTLDLPFGMGCVVKSTKNSVAFNAETYEWTVKGKAKATSTLILILTPFATGLKTLRVYPTTAGHYDAFMYVGASHQIGFDEVAVTPSTLRRGERSCFNFNVRTQVPSNTFTIQALWENPNTIKANDIIDYSLNEDFTSEGVTLDSVTVRNGEGVLMTFNVPNTLLNHEVHFEANLCYYPRTSGDKTMYISTSNDLAHDVSFSILPPYEKHVVFNTDEYGQCTNTINITNNRVISQVEGDMVILPIHVDEYDTDMYVDESSFKINQWQKRRYFGCVELPYAHYDPKHTSKDKLHDKHYKNKEYLGKENAVDEDITLKIKVPRRKVPTLVGLLDIDRPQPVNLVPSAFEGDPLNHRGWVEYTGIEIEPTNPLYDTCELDVKYITHNIISRFSIFRGSTKQYNLPDVFINSLMSGEDIGEFFSVTTDGSYIYDDNTDETHRNMFSFTNQQSILLRSKNLLAAKSQFEFYWDMVLFDELRENNIDKIIRLVDDRDNVVFEYEYYDFDFSDSVYSCKVIGRLLTEQGYSNPINREIYVHSDVEYTSDVTDEEYDDESIDLYGSKVSFEIDANKLTITENGFSGHEFSQQLVLQKGSYYLEVEWKNRNNDSDTRNILTYFDFVVNELTFDTQLAAYYQKLVVTPFPIPNKKIVFTRESEEGTIYFLEDDGGDYDFLLEPFYQYFCGVDLVAEGASIFNFNNSYPVIYIQNGLIRFGINRINGDLYLDKYDVSSQDYIRTNRFRIDKFDDAEVGIINDDMITVNVSDMHFTMWRGRPYVLVEHKTEDIHILDTFNKAFADGVNDRLFDYPIVYELMNSKNLLPDCIGGTLLKSSCITVEEGENLTDIGDFIILPDKTECSWGEAVDCTLSGNFKNKSVYLLANGEIIGSNVGNKINGALWEEGVVTIQAVYVGDETTNMELSNMVNVQVSRGIQPPEVGEEFIYHLEYIGENQYTYNQGEVAFKLTRNGEPVEGITIEVYTPRQTAHITTNAQGIVKWSIANVLAGTETWIATAYDNGLPLTKPCKKSIKIVKSTPIIKGSTLSLIRGNKCGFRITDEAKNGMAGVTLDIDIGGTKYVRTTSENGYVGIKMSKEGTYTANVTYAGENHKYKKVTATFTVEVKEEKEKSEGK